VGLILVLGVVLYAEYGPSKWMPPLRWWGFAAATALTFGYPLRWYRHLARHAQFWIAFLAMLVVHSAAYVLLLLRATEWPLILFALITPAEWFVICPILDRFGAPDKDACHEPYLTGEKKSDIMVAEFEEAKLSEEGPQNLRFEISDLKAATETQRRWRKEIEQGNLKFGSQIRRPQRRKERVER
jgi:hypothetical protein